MNPSELSVVCPSDRTEVSPSESSILASENMSSAFFAIAFGFIASNDVLFGEIGAAGLTGLGVLAFKIGNGCFVKAPAKFKK